MYCEAVFEVEKSLAEEAGAAAFAAGASGVEIIEEDSGQLKMLHTPPSEGYAKLVVMYALETNSAEALQALYESLDELGIEPKDQLIDWRKCENQDWEHAWKEFFKPLCLGERLWIVPSWEKAFVPPKDALILELDPGMAFGTGQHATTALCVAEIVKKIEEVGPLAMLDFGCGSGILAMTAAKMGCKEVDAIDNDPLAVQIAQENAQQNNLQIAISTTDITALTKTYPLIVANILAVTLIEYVAEVIKRLAKGGTLILSGILAEQQETVVEAYLRHSPSLKLLQVKQQQEWVALVFQA